MLQIPKMIRIESEVEGTPKILRRIPTQLKTPELKKELMKRQAELEKDKKAMAAVETLKALAGI